MHYKSCAFFHPYQIDILFVDAILIFNFNYGHYLNESNVFCQRRDARVLLKITVQYQLMLLSLACCRFLDLVC